MREHDGEPIRGLPEQLPQGERILWQGSPDWKALALRALHVRAVLIYFALLFVWSVGMSLSEGETLGAALANALTLVPVALVAAGILAFYAWLTARSTVYTITSRRVVMRFGVALPMTLNVPFTVIGNAALRNYQDGTGDIPLTLSGTDRVSYLALWPHVRPWRLKRPEPMLRSVRDAGSVAERLGQALEQASRGRADASDAVALSVDQQSVSQPRQPAAA